MAATRKDQDIGELTCADDGYSQASPLQSCGTKCMPKIHVPRESELVKQLLTDAALQSHAGSVHTLIKLDPDATC